MKNTRLINAFILQAKNFFISRHVVFDELTFPYKPIHMSCIAANQPQVMSIFDSWLPHTNTSSSAGLLTDSSSPPCHSPLPPIAVHTPETHFQPSSPIESSPAFSPIIESHTPAGNNELLEFPNHTGSLDTFPPQEPQVSDNQNITARLRIIETPESSQHNPVPSAPLNHPMVTRFKLGVVKPNPKYALNTITSSNIPREPHNVKIALVHPGWKAAMDKELAALHKNDTWTLVPSTPNMHVIGSKWVFKSKLKPDGSLDRLKVCLVAKGYHQIDGVDYTETFSPVIKPGTIRMIITIALVQKWSICQLDVKNAFLHGLISEDLYMQQPPGMVDPQHPTHVCKL